MRQLEVYACHDEMRQLEVYELEVYESLATSSYGLKLLVPSATSALVYVDLRYQCERL